MMSEKWQTTSSQEGAIIFGCANSDLPGEYNPTEP
jgi:hypothetical protein